MVAKIFTGRPTRPVCWYGSSKSNYGIRFWTLLDIPGLNYRVHLYEEAFSNFLKVYFGFRNSFNGQL
jgi:hypothetical protein